MSNDVPVQETMDSPSVATDANNLDQIDLQRKADADLEAFALNYLTGGEPQNESEVEEDEVVVESEDASDETEELSEDEADVDTPDEAEEDDSNEESGQDFEILDYDEWSKYALEIGGQHYTPAQLKSLVGRADSVGKNAREANQLKEELTAQKQQLAEREAFLNQRTSAAAQSDEMARLQREYQTLQEETNGMDPESNLYDINLNREKMNRVASRYQSLKQEVDQVNAQHEAEMIARAEQGLKERDLGYLLEDNKESRAWLDYAQNNLTESVINTVKMDASLAALVEKARKYDAKVSPKTVKTSKVKSSGKTLKAGTNKPSTPKKQEANPDDFFLQLAKDTLGR